MVAQKTTH